MPMRPSDQTRGLQQDCMVLGRCQFAILDRTTHAFTHQQTASPHWGAPVCRFAREMREADHGAEPSSGPSCIPEFLLMASSLSLRVFDVPIDVPFEYLLFSFQ